MSSCQERPQGDPAAVIPIGHVPGNQGHAHIRHHLGEPDQAEGERVLRDLIHRPPHHHVLDLRDRSFDRGRSSIRRERRQPGGGVPAPLDRAPRGP